MILRQVKESPVFKVIPDLADYLRDHGNAINQLLRRWAMTTLAAITGNVNDYDPRDATVLRLSTSGSFAIRGISQVHEGKILTIINVGANDLVLANQHASATAVNRIITADGANLTLAPKASAILLYDLDSARWRVIATGTGTSGGITDVTATAPISSTGGPTPDISHDDSGVAPGSYTNADITVDEQGHITDVANGGGSQLIEHAVITANAGSFTFAATLDGNTDGVYRIVGRVKRAGGDMRLKLIPNAVTTNQASLAHFRFSGDGAGPGAAGVSEQQSYMSLGISFAPSYLHFDITFFAKYDPNGQAFHRMYNGTWGAGDGLTTGTVAGGWIDSTTNITGFTISSTDGATGIGNGSEFWLYREAQ